MFETLSERLGGVFDKLTGRGALSEADVDAALREVRVALLEADVALPVVKDFIAKVRAEAVGEAVIKSVKPGQQVIKIVHDALVDMLGGDAPPEPLRDRRRAAERHHDGRPAGLGQNHHHRQDRAAADQDRQAPRADGLARHAPAGGDGAARDAGQDRSASTCCRSSPVNRRKRSPSAR